ncbi:sensor histidine kinase [Parvularcula maris]|uniref:histidine kinase n=1 Tax=Parvularcula maris TaxID=2965077 RepID=A0A9X2L867_9PROT|nr:histidine kinase dimerization/phosphoacceptor domain -containing protein [Parvularcula maris]MCQ8184880.1 tetratricopeptide repeat protein [Parvularcula maris]
MADLIALKGRQAEAAAQSLLTQGRYDLVTPAIVSSFEDEVPPSLSSALRSALLLAEVKSAPAKASTEAEIEELIEAAEKSGDLSSLAYLYAALAARRKADGQWDEITGALDLAFTAAEQAGFEGLLPHLQFARGESAVRTRAYGDALPWLRPAYESFLASGRRMDAGEVCQLMAGSWAYDPERSSENIERAAAGSGGDRPCRIAAVFYRGQRDQLPYAEMERRGLAAAKAAGEAGLDTMSPWLLNSIAMAAARNGNYGAAANFYSQARGGFEAVGNLFMVAAVASNEAVNLVEIGARDEAIPILERSLAIFRETAPDRQDSILKVQRQLGLAHEGEGRLAEAELWLARAYETSRAFTNRYYDGLVGSDYARILYARGRQAEGLAMADDAVAVLLAEAQVPDKATAAKTLSWAAEQYLRRGEIENAQATLERAGGLMDPGGEGAKALADSPWELMTRLQYARSMSDLLFALDRRDEAAAYARVALTLSENRLEEQKIRAMANAELQRVVAENEMKIASLGQEAEMTAAVLKHTRARAFLGGGAALAASIAALAVYRSYRTQKQLSESKETFLAEIHHRMANNLQIITSLLRVEARADKASLKDAANRARTMGLIHHHIYHHGQDKFIDAEAFLRALVVLMGEALERPGVTIELDAEPVALDISAATPVGLIVCEAVTNAYKYAFEDSQTGTVTVGLDDEGSTITLTVADDGCGMSKDEPRGGSQGQRLMADLAQQIGGVLSVLDHPGGGTLVAVKGIPKGLETQGEPADFQDLPQTGENA